MVDLINFGSILELPRGLPVNREPLRLDMLKVNIAENRLQETRVVNIGTMAELISVFNESCNITNKYVSWIKYELLQAKKEFDLAKASVIIDKVPDMAKDRGVKDNADFRNAAIARDSDCNELKDIMLHLEAAQTFLEAKAKSFERAYWDCRDNIKRNTSNPALPNYNSFNDNMQAQVHAHAPSQSQESPAVIDVSPSFIGTSKF